jgi:hypothetical protein
MAVMKYRDPDTGQWSEVGSSGVTDHGNLTGLDDDDHPQYVKRTGDTVTGTITVPSPTERGAAANKGYVDDQIVEHRTAGVVIQPVGSPTPDPAPYPVGTILAVLGDVTVAVRTG